MRKIIWLAAALAMALPMLASATPVSYRFYCTASSGPTTAVPRQRDLRASFGHGLH